MLQLMKMIEGTIHMTSSFEFNLNSFLKEYWRRKPLVIRNGSDFFTSKRLDSKTFVEAVRKLNPDKWGDINDLDNKNKVIFCDNISSQIDYLNSDAKLTADKLNLIQKCCFDGSYSMPGHGIGRHFDDSDNFVIQQEGRRLWVLSSREIVTKNERKNRANRLSNTGAVNNFREKVYIVLNPGDVLYLPIFYPHWGISLEKSLSITFAVQSASAIRSLYPSMLKVIQEKNAWWNPLPSHKVDLLSEEYISLLSESINSKEFIKEVINSYINNFEDSVINEEMNEELKYNKGPFEKNLWDPSEGIDVWNNQFLEYTNQITQDQVETLMENADEQTIDDFRKLLKI